MHPSHEANGLECSGQKNGSTYRFEGWHEISLMVCRICVCVRRALFLVCVCVCVDAISKSKASNSSKISSNITARTAPKKNEQEKKTFHPPHIQYGSIRLDWPKKKQQPTNMEIKTEMNSHRAEKKTEEKERRKCTNGLAVVVAHKE